MQIEAKDIIEKEFEESITNGIPYLLFDTSPDGIKIWIKSMKESFHQRMEAIDLLSKKKMEIVCGKE